MACGREDEAQSKEDYGMNFATIKAVYDEGVALAFDDGSE